MESEGFDRVSLALPGRQDELVTRIAAVNPRVVVVVNTGAPVLLPWRDEVAAILLSWFPGQEFGHALADVLLGVAEPGGRLPTTWPAKEDAVLPSTTPTDGDLTYAEGLHIGHRRFIKDDVKPAYWFGHGLGYTTWDYEAPTGSWDEDGQVAVNLRVTNTGRRTGRQVIQVYASRPSSSVERAQRWLVGYTSVQADPGQTVTAQITVARHAFEHWDVSKHCWAMESGTFLLYPAISAVETLGCLAVVPVDESVTSV